MATICATNSIPDFNSGVLTEVPHQDGPPNIALQKPGTVDDKPVTLTATLGDGDKIMTFKVVGNPGAAERFISAGNVYVAIRPNVPTVAFPKSGPWTQA